MKQTSKFALKIVTSTCKVFDAGYYMEDGGLSVNEVRHPFLSVTSSFSPCFGLKFSLTVCLFFMTQVIFNTLRVEAEATSQSAPSGAYKPSTSYFVLNPKMNRSIASLRSLKPQLIGPAVMFSGIENNNSSSRAAVFERFENENVPDDTENDSLNVTFTSLIDNGKNSRVEYVTNSRSPMDQLSTYANGEPRVSYLALKMSPHLCFSFLDHSNVCLSFCFVLENPSKMATSRSSAPSSQSSEAKQSGSNLKRFRNVIRMSGSTMSLTSWLGRGWVSSLFADAAAAVAADQLQRYGV